MLKTPTAKSAMPPTLPESLSPIAARLLSPAESVPLEALPGRWFHQRIAVRLAGAAAAAGDPALPGRVRGAWGHRL
ncbi:MAG: hypothetical protein GVY13_12510, partial [Alphaproteobacteria bacterium]|nr:hypothetical protein [Alphaproteobacteria bacterium]